MAMVQKLLSLCEQGLKKWSSIRCNSYSSDIKTKSVRLKEMQDCEDPSNVVEIKCIQQELNNLME